MLGEAQLLVYQVKVNLLALWKKKKSIINFNSEDFVNSSFSISS